MNLFPNKLSKTNEMSLKNTLPPKEQASLETKCRRVAIYLYIRHVLKEMKPLFIDEWIKGTK
jgi:hypothetical protein